MKWNRCFEVEELFMFVLESVSNFFFILLLNTIELYYKRSKIFKASFPTYGNSRYGYRRDKKTASEDAEAFVQHDCPPNRSVQAKDRKHEAYEANMQLKADLPNKDTQIRTCQQQLITYTICDNIFGCPCQWVLFITSCSHHKSRNKKDNKT